LIPARGACRLALRAAVANWSLTSSQQRLVKTGGRLIKHARYYWLLLAEPPDSAMLPLWREAARTRSEKVNK
jgi:hypothetical protein